MSIGKLKKSERLEDAKKISHNATEYIKDAINILKLIENKHLPQEPTKDELKKLYDAVMHESNVLLEKSVFLTFGGFGDTKKELEQYSKYYKKRIDYLYWSMVNITEAVSELMENEDAVMLPLTRFRELQEELKIKIKKEEQDEKE